VSARCPVGSTVLHREQAWQVVGLRGGTRKLRSLDGRTTVYEAADRLRSAP
jgi:hypothetical protein